MTNSPNPISPSPEERKPQPIMEQTIAPLVSQAPKPYDLNSETPAGLPLTTGVEADQLVIRIGVDTLAFCFEVSEDNQPYDEKAGDFRRSWKVTDKHKFARGVAFGLLDEEEDGSTPISRILDAACIRAIEDAMGVDEDGRIVTNEMLHPAQPVSPLVSETPQKEK